jgi:hypothetical protein
MARQKTLGLSPIWCHNLREDEFSFRIKAHLQFHECFADHRHGHPESDPVRHWSAAALLAAAVPHVADAGISGLEDGTYDAFDCGVPISDERFELSDETLTFYESSCRLSSPQTLRDLPGAVLVDADCMGEGQTWRARFILMQTRDGGMAFLQEGWGGHYARCD